MDIPSFRFLPNKSGIRSQARKELQELPPDLLDILLLILLFRFLHLLPLLFLLVLLLRLLLALHHRLLIGLILRLTRDHNIISWQQQLTPMMGSPDGSDRIEACADYTATRGRGPRRPV
jgi:hypothetical protein